MAAGRQPPTFCKITPDYQSQRITPEINPKIIIKKLSQIPVAKTRKKHCCPKVAFTRKQLLGTDSIWWGLANAEIGEKAEIFHSTMHSVNTNKWNLMWPICCSSFVDATPEENSGILKMMMKT